MQIHAHLPTDGEDPFGASALDVHHCISDVRKKPLDLADFGTGTDPAMKNFVPKLREHLLGRFLNREFDGDTSDEFTPEDLNTVRFINNRIYSTKLLRVNYTAYDVRRDQDVLNATAQPFVMVKAPEGETHPYWYAQILGVFNASVFRVAPPAPRTQTTVMEFLWVRWLGTEPGYREGIRKARLPQVGFVEETDPYAFGFLDPEHVIRGSHLLPRFHGGRTNDLLATQADTAARRLNDTEDWANYYVNIFADRDMLMRYVGGGIGHQDVEALSGTDIQEEEDEDFGPQDEQEDPDDESDHDSDLDSSWSEAEEEGEGEGEGEDLSLPLGEEEEEEEGDGDMDVDTNTYAAF
ncbi:hypothetical protein C8R47DRAFT_1056070 [Mycena vitilis]|nr:hypothetical protein C8R47DRAFT_1056070 [Mycena vitilis]